LACPHLPRAGAECEEHLKTRWQKPITGMVRERDETLFHKEMFVIMHSFINIRFNK
jgi:hypothetical protein